MAKVNRRHFLRMLCSMPIVGLLLRLKDRQVEPTRKPDVCSDSADEANIYVKRFDWLNRTASKILRKVREEEKMRLELSVTNNASKVLEDVAGQALAVTTIFQQGIKAVVDESEPKTLETLMGFPIKWIESPATEHPLGNIVLGNLGEVFDEEET